MAGCRARSRSVRMQVRSRSLSPGEHCIALHCIALNCIALNCIALQQMGQLIFARPQRKAKKLVQRSASRTPAQVIFLGVHSATATNQLRCHPAGRSITIYQPAVTNQVIQTVLILTALDVQKSFGPRPFQPFYMQFFFCIRPGAVCVCLCLIISQLMAATFAAT